MSQLSENDELGKIARIIASKIPCQMCRAKGGEHVVAGWGCCHQEGLTSGEVVERLNYAWLMQDAARNLLSNIEKNIVEHWEKVEFGLPHLLPRTIHPFGK